MVRTYHRFGVFLVFGRAPQNYRCLVGFIGILFLIAYALEIGNVAQRLHLIMHTPTDPRVALWLVAWEMFKEAPLLGKGIHTFGEFYPNYLTRIQIPRG